MEISKNQGYFYFKDLLVKHFLIFHIQKCSILSASLHTAPGPLFTKEESNRTDETFCELQSEKVLLLE